MAYVTQYPDWWVGNAETYSAPPPPHIVVHALKENKRPIGFAPWPKQKKRKKQA